MKHNFGKSCTMDRYQAGAAWHTLTQLGIWTRVPFSLLPLASLLFPLPSLSPLHFPPPPFLSSTFPPLFFSFFPPFLLSLPSLLSLRFFPPPSFSSPAHPEPFLPTLLSLPFLLPPSFSSPIHPALSLLFLIFPLPLKKTTKQMWHRLLDLP
jgi:hypothetical protein